MIDKDQKSSVREDAPASGSNRGCGFWLISVYLVVPGLLLIFLGFLLNQANGCEWSGEEFECWDLGDPKIFFLMGSVMLTLGFLSLHLLRQTKR
jgi:hypothetical protein